MTFYKVCLESEITNEKLKKFVVDDSVILIAKANDGSIYAFDYTCTHADKSLEKGQWNAATAEVTCPFHKAVFAIAENGAVKAPPACSPLPIYKIIVKNEDDVGVVYVDV